MAEAVSATCSCPAPSVLGLFRLTRRLFLLLTIALLAGMAACVVGVGRLLVDPGAREAVEPADAIVALAGANADRWLEAYELWREGHAPRIVLSPGWPDGAERELARRGVHVPNGAEVARGVLTGSLAVPPGAVEILEGPLDNTAAEAETVAQVAAARGWRRVIVVTSLAHTRRTRYAMERAFTPAGVAVQVRASRFDRFNAAQWWRRRSDIRWVLTELPKLAAYRLGVGS